MKKYFLKIKEFIGRYKGEQWLKYTVIIIALLIAAAAASEWRKWQDSRELPNTEISEEALENDEPDIIEKIWDDSKAHFIVFGGLTVSLFIVKYRNAVKLEESGRKIKK